MQGIPECHTTCGLQEWQELDFELVEVSIKRHVEPMGVGGHTEIQISAFGAHSRHRECQELRRCLCNLFGLIADLQELSAIQNSICLRVPKRGWILTQILWRFSKLLPCLWPRLLIQTSWQDLCVLQFCVCHLSHAQRPRWEFRGVWIPSGTQG